MTTPEFKMFSPQYLSLKHKHKQQQQIVQLPHSPLVTPAPPPTPSPPNLPDLALGLGVSQNLTVRHGRPSAVSVELPASAGAQQTRVALSQSLSYGHDRASPLEAAALLTRSPPPKLKVSAAASLLTADRSQVELRSARVSAGASDSRNPSRSSRSASREEAELWTGEQVASEGDQQVQMRTHVRTTSARTPFPSSFARPASTTPEVQQQTQERQQFAATNFVRSRSHTPTPATYSAYSRPNVAEQPPNFLLHSLQPALTNTAQVLNPLSLSTDASLPNYPPISSRMSGATTLRAARGESIGAGGVSQLPPQRVTTFTKRATNVERQESADDVLVHNFVGGRGRSSSTASRTRALGGSRARTAANSRALTPSTTMTPLQIEDNENEDEAEVEREQKTSTNPLYLYSAAAQRSDVEMRNQLVEAGAVAGPEITRAHSRECENPPAQSQQQLKTRLRDTISYV